MATTSTYFLLLLIALLTSPHFIDSCRGDEWNPTATSFAQGATMLKTLAIRRSREHFQMSDEAAIYLLAGNLPSDFNVWNERPRACVEIQLRIVEGRSIQGREEIVKTWNVEVDADCQQPNPPRPQRPHYGYSVDAIINGRRLPKFTGHVYLPSNPANCRPWNTKGNVTYLTAQRPGKAPNVMFKLTGKMFKQYEKRIDGQYLDDI